MRKVAQALGVEAMALYHHVAGKEALVEAVVDAVFAEMEPPEPQEDRRAGLERRCWSMRSALARHSWVLGLIESRDTVGPHRLRHHDAVLGSLLGGGLSAFDAVLAVSTLDSFVYGFVLQEQQQAAPADADGAGDPSIDELAAALGEELEGATSEEDAAEALPHLRAVALAVAAGPAPTHDEAFAHGLRIVLNGLDGLDGLDGLGGTGRTGA